MSVETDKVLSAIRRGEDSLPKLRAATGFEYAQLHTELYKLEFDYGSIRRTETADGFDRYTPTPREKSNGNKGTHWSQEHPIPPAALVQSKLSLAAREVSLLQRDAPYCIQCRGLCFVTGSGRRIEWQCRVCDVTFEGSSEQQAMGYVQPESEPKISAMRPCEPLGPEEDRALAVMRDEPVEETCVDCGKPRSIGSGQRCRECYLARAEAKRTDPPPSARLCGCGRPSNHGGRCSFRRQAKPSLADDLAAKRRATNAKQNGGRPRIEVDLQKFEDLLANPRLSINEVCEGARIKRNLIYDRKDIDPEFGAAYRRGMERREAAIADGKLKTPEDLPENLSESVQNITETITKSYGPFCEANCVPDGISHHKDCAYWKEAEARRRAVARNSTIVEAPKTGNAESSFQSEDKTEGRNTARAVELQSECAKPTHIMRENIPTAQVQVMGGMKFREDVEIRLSEMQDWPAERISEFFETLSKLIEIPHRPLPTTINPAWSPSLEGEVGDPESTVGLTYCYLVGMLHHNMEPHEKEAVWTLVQYLKRLEAYVEQERGLRCS